MCHGRGPVCEDGKSTGPGDAPTHGSSLIAHCSKRRCRVKAAVLWERRTPLVIEEIDIADPAPGEARVKIGVSGVCHSDLHQINRDTPSLPPLVLGHEAAG